MQKVTINKIRIYYYVGSLLPIIFLSIFLTNLFSRSMHKEYINSVVLLKNEVIDQKKLFLKNTIERTFDEIDYEINFAKQQYPLMSEREIDIVVKERIKERINKLRLVDKGYIWVNRIVDYAGGDGYGVREIHPNLPHTQGQLLSTNTTDIKGNLPYNTELNGIKANGEVFYEYYFKKMDSDMISHKLSYAKLYRNYDWVIATGVYLDDIEELAATKSAEMHKVNIENSNLAYIISAIMLVVTVLLVVLFENKVLGIITSYQKDLEASNKGLQKEKEAVESALVEIKQLKGIFPICASCKKIRDDEGYWSQVEEYISKNSEAEFSHSICPDCVKKLYGNEKWIDGIHQP